MIIFLLLFLLTNSHQTTPQVKHHSGVVHDYRKLVAQSSSSAHDYWKTLLNGEKPTIVRVVGDDCSACIATSPIYRDIAHKYGSKGVNFIDINIHENSNRLVLKPYHVKSLPTFMFLYKGDVHILKEHSKMNREILSQGIREYFHIE
jgi:thiol-disulfide isomerase/thioredoxin